MGNAPKIHVLVRELLAFSLAELRAERKASAPIGATAIAMRAAEQGYFGDGCSSRWIDSSRFAPNTIEARPSLTTRERLDALGASERRTAEFVMEDAHGDGLAEVNIEGRAYTLSLAARAGFELAPPKQRKQWLRKFAERDSRPAILGSTELGETLLAELAKAWGELSEPPAEQLAEPPAEPPAPASPEVVVAPPQISLAEPPSDDVDDELVATPTTKRPGFVELFDPDEGWSVEFEGRCRAIALERRGSDMVREIRELSLSRVVLEGLGGREGVEVDRLEDIAQRGAPFVLVRGERRVDGAVVWVCFALDPPTEEREATIAA